MRKGKGMYHMKAFNKCRTPPFQDTLNIKKHISTQSQGEHSSLVLYKLKSNYYLGCNCFTNVKIIAMRISNLLKNLIAEILNSMLKKTHKLQL